MWILFNSLVLSGEWTDLVQTAVDSVKVNEDKKCVFVSFVQKAFSVCGHASACFIEKSELKPHSFQM